MLKRLLFLCGFALLAGCTQEPKEDEGGVASQDGAIVIGSESGALPGTLAIRLNPDVADAVEAATRTRGGAATRSGFDQMDLVFNQIGVEHFSRMVPYEEEYEAGYRESGLSFWYRVNFGEGTNLTEAVEALRKCPEVAVVEYSTLPKRMDVKPVFPLNRAMALESGVETRAGLPMNDPQLQYQWHYQNTGPSGKFTTRKAGADIDLFDAWDICTGGEDIIVAVIDEPVQYTHPDLEANMWINPNPTKNDIHGYNFWNQTEKLDWTGFTYVEGRYEYVDHGTHVAGTIAAVNNNGMGCCGIAGGRNGVGGVKIMSCQILGNSDVNANPDAAVQSFTYAANNGAVIAQCSWGYDPYLSEGMWEYIGGSLRTAIDYFIKNAGSKNSKFPNSPLSGGLVIFAAGNDGHNVTDNKVWPSAYKPVIAVAAMGWDFQPAYFTNYGKWVDITAPGGDYLTSKVGATSYSEGGILSTILQDPSIDYKDERDESGCGFMQGTSMACPHISGIAALGLAYASKIGRKYTPSEFASLLLSSTRDLTPYLTGTKAYIKDNKQPGTLNLENYRRKMGRGYVDALGLLLNIKGTPAVYVQRENPTIVDLSKYFGGAASTLTITSATISQDGLAKLGLSATPEPLNGTMLFDCKNAGSATVVVQGLAGDVVVAREFVVISRDGLASNGGWL